MKILYCENLQTSSLASWSIHVYEVVNNLNKMGHEVVLLNNESPDLDTKINKWRQPLQDSLKRIFFKSRFFRPFAGYITIAGLFILELKVFFSAFRILITHKKRFDVIYRRHNLFSSERILARIFKIPLVREVNGIYSDEIKAQKRGDRFSWWILNRIERSSMPKADKVVSVTAKLKDVLHYEYGIPEGKIAVIPNGANIDLFKPMDPLKVRVDLGLSPNDKYVCFVGNLVKWLGVENLVNSAPLILAELPDTKFLIVGDGGLKEELKKQATMLNVIDKFIFTGMVPYEQVPLYMNAADICVMPAEADFRNSRMGASPLKLHEYMACGKPVVAGDISGDIQEIRDSGSGLLVDPTNPEEVSRAMITLLKNETLRNEMGQRARQIVVDKYSWRKNAQHVAEVCQSAINP